jgi:hypothetical protein
MASPPDLLGRFADNLSEHKRLGVTLRRLGDMCAALKSERPVLIPDLQPPLLTADFFVELSKHFQSEEGDAHFGAIVMERPSLLPKIARLKVEHVVLLEAASELRTIAAHSSRWTELVALTLRLVAELRTHEHAETELMQEFFLRDDGVAQE